MEIEATIVSIADRKLRAQYPGVTLERDVIRRAAVKTAGFLGHGPGSFILNALSPCLRSGYPSRSAPATVMSDPTADHIDWYRGERKLNRRFFDRYADQLRTLQWPEASVQAIDDATDRIMEWMEGPLRGPLGILAASWSVMCSRERPPIMPASYPRRPTPATGLSSCWPACTMPCVSRRRSV